MNYSSIAWLPICAALTAIGFVLSYYYGRRRGSRSMLRGAAWSLLPIAAYLTGSIEMFWKIGVAIGHFADGFAFSPMKWAGIGVAGLSALLFFATRTGKRRKEARLARKAARAQHGTQAQHGGSRRDTEGTGHGAAGLAGTAGTAGALDKAGQPGTRALGTLMRNAQEPAPAPAEEAGTADAAQAKPAGNAKPSKSSKQAAAGPKAPARVDDDLKDIDEILRKRGI